MTSRYQAERQQVERYLPPSTRHVRADGQDIWIFQKETEVGVRFEIALYYDADECDPGYCAQLVSPEIEATWHSPHIGHIFSDGVLCLGGTSMRTRRTLLEAFSKSCLWAEGMAIMIVGQINGQPCAFPFSNNNREQEVT